MADFKKHETAEISERALVGPGTFVWHHCQVREGAVIGSECILGKGAYVDRDVKIGDRCKLQNGVFVYEGAIVEDGVFFGPGSMALNDQTPRAVSPEGKLKSASDWKVSGVTVRTGASIGGGAILNPGVTVGRWAMVGSGSVVTRDVPDHGLVYGNPARLQGYVCSCGTRAKAEGKSWICPKCARRLEVKT